MKKGRFREEVKTQTKTNKVMKKKIYAEISEYQAAVYGGHRFQDGDYEYEYPLTRKIKEGYDDDAQEIILDKYLKRVNSDDTGTEWEGKLEDEEIQKMFSELDEIFE